MLPITDDNPQINRPVITYSLIAANFVIWALVQNFEGVLFCELGLIPEIVLNAGITTECSTSSIGSLSLITHAFIHGDWMHIIFNMWILYVFGNNVEDIMGGLRFLIFYLVAAMLSGIFFAVATDSMVIPLGGASGALSAVMAAYFWTYPKAKVHTFFPLGVAFFIVQLPSWVMIGYWAAVQFAYLEIFQTTQSEVAFSAHAGGLIAGSLMLKLFRQKALVARHEYAGWDAEPPPSQLNVPSHFKILNYCLMIGAIAVLIIEYV